MSDSGLIDAEILSYCQTFAGSYLDVKLKRQPNDGVKLLQKADIGVERIEVTRGKAIETRLPKTSPSVDKFTRNVRDKNNLFGRTIAGVALQWPVLRTTVLLAQ